MAYVRLWLGAEVPHPVSRRLLGTESGHSHPNFSPGSGLFPFIYQGNPLKFLLPVDDRRLARRRQTAGWAGRNTAAVAMETGTEK